MNKQNSYDLEKEIEKKFKKHDKRKKSVMKVSGSSVRDLQRIIRKEK